MSKRRFVYERRQRKNEVDTAYLGEQMTIEEGVKVFATARKAEGLRERTIADYYKTSNWFIAYLKEHFPDCKYISDITPHILRSYVNYMLSERTPFEGDKKREQKGAKLSPYTVNIRLRVLRSMCKFWHQEGYIPSNPAENVKTVKIDSDNEDRGFTEDEVKRLLAVPKERIYAEFRDKVLMLLLIDTGIRINEAVNLTIDNIDKKKLTITIPAEIAKNRKSRTIPVSKPVVKLLFELHEEVKYYFGKQIKNIFMSAYGEPLSKDTFRRRLWRYAKQAGVKKASPHMFRHFFCRQYLIRGGDVYSLQRIVDHADLSTTKRYVSLKPEHLRQQHTQFSPIKEFLD